MGRRTPRQECDNRHAHSAKLFSWSGIFHSVCLFSFAARRQVGTLTRTRGPSGPNKVPGPDKPSAVHDLIILFRGANRVQSIGSTPLSDFPRPHRSVIWPSSGPTVVGRRRRTHLRAWWWRQTHVCTSPYSGVRYGSEIIPSGSPCAAAPSTESVMADGRGLNSAVMVFHLWVVPNTIL